MGTYNIFVYGSLMSEKVMQCLLGRIPPMQAATLNGKLHSMRREMTVIVEQRISPLLHYESRVPSHLSHKFCLCFGVVFFACF
jgi:hypothetical protein